jgi:hypothetical protein
MPRESTGQQAVHVLSRGPIAPSQPDGSLRSKIPAAARRATVSFDFHDLIDIADDFLFRLFVATCAT